MKTKTEWIDRIFQRLEEIYEDRWHLCYKKGCIDIYKSSWASGLADLTAKEIKKALDKCSDLRYSDIPTLLDFYRYAKAPDQPPKNTRVPRRTLRVWND